MRAKHWVVTVAVLTLGCAREPAQTGSAPAAGSTGAGPAGAPSDGVAAQAARLATSREAQRALVRELVEAVVAASGGGGAVAPGLVEAIGALASRPVVTARVAVEEQAVGAGTRRRVAVDWRLVALNDGEAALEKVILVVPPTVADGRLELRAVRVDGSAVSAEFGPCAAGTGGCWTIPTAVAPGARVSVELELAGALPSVRPPVELEALPDLARLAPVVDNVAIDQAFGQSVEAAGEGDLVLAGLWPRWTGGPVLGSVEASLPSGGVDRAARSVVGNATIVSERAQDATSQVRMVDLGGADFVLVMGSGLGIANGSAGAQPLVARLPARVAGANATVGGEVDVLGAVRDALEARPAVATTGVGLPVVPLTIVATATLDGRGVASAPGIVLVPRSLVTPRAVSEDAQAPSGIGGLLEGVIAHHPAPREALDLALATAVLAMPWRGRGADAGAELVLAEGLARAQALALIGERRGDKARRRALELGLKLPYQLGRMRAEPDPTLATVGAGSRIAGAKAGLFADALQRHLGAEVFQGLVAGLAPTLTLQDFREAVLRVAPRPAEAKALMARWLDEARGDDDIGPLRPELLLEYLITDGAIGGLGAELMGRLRPEDLGALGGGGAGGGGALGALGQALGKGEMDLGLALSMAADLLGKDADPATRKWLELGKKMLGGAEAKKDALNGLLDELGQELGLPEGERARLNALGAQVMDALDQQLRAPSIDEEELAPPPDAPTER
jgi:hypothetical protein